MKNILQTLIILAFFTAISACIVKAVKPTDPCRSKEFAGNLSNYSKNELEHLEKILKNNSYAKPGENGCQAALLAKLYIEQGRMSEASNSFALAAQKIPELRDYFMLAKAKTELKAGHYQDAKKIAQSLLESKQSSKFINKVHQLLADLAVILKDDQQIIETHKQVLKDSGAENEDRLYNLAQSLSKLGKIDEADEVFRQLLVRYPSSPEAKKVAQQVSLTLSEQEGRFNKLIGKLAFDQAVADADSALKNNKNADEISKSTYNSFAVKSLVLNNKFEQGLNRAQVRAKSAKATPKDLETYAWTLGKVDRFMEAADYYSRFAKDSTDLKDKAKGCFFTGFSLYEASLYSMALYSWQQCQHLMDNSPLKENFLWYQALSSMLIGHFDHAYPVLSDLMKNFKSTENEKYAYFVGYSLHQLNKKNAGDTVFRELVQKNQPSYYVMLARKFLGLGNPRGKKLSPDALSQLADKCQKPACQNALTLHHLGFGEEARDMILTAKLTNEERLSMLQHFGNYHEVWRRSYLLNPEATIKNGALDTNYRIRASYPLPHQPLIDEMSRKYSVPQNLLYAIIRAESGFLTDAESYRGALGLMQMMPFVATDLATKLNFEQFSADHLKDPKVSLELGTLFLATLKRQFDTTHLVIAAYNAGPHQVQKWLNRFGHLPIDLFVERIPFEQTRTYVKKVSSSASLYYALNGKALKLVF